MNVSDSHFDFENKYEDDFYDDDVSADENNQDDSGMEEKIASQNSYDTDSDNESDNKNLTSQSQTPSQNKKLPKKKNNSNKLLNGKSSKSPFGSDPYKSYLTSTSRRVQSDLRVRKNKKADSSLSASNKPPSVAPQNAVIKRVLSASRKKTSALHNVIYELQQQVEALTIANKDLKRSTRVQERDLRKLDGTEAQIPALLKKHSNEINVLQEKWKRQREISNNLTENLKKADHDLLKTKDSLKEYQAIVKQKNLGERIELQNKIFELEKVIEEKDRKILEVNRSLNLQKKGQSRIIKDKNEKYEKLNDRVKHLHQEQEELLQRLKEREKALEVTNIYSRRVPKDGRQVILFSPEDPVDLIPRKYQEENRETYLPIETSYKSPDGPNDGRSSVHENIDTMVNQNESNDKVNEQKSPPSTFLTEGKLKRQATEEFYDVNNRKITTKGKKEDEDNIPADSLGADMLHEKLDKLFVERDKDDKTESINENVKELSLNDNYKLKKRIDRTSPFDSIDNVVSKNNIVNPEIEKPTTPAKDDNKISLEIDNETRKKQLLLAKIQAIDNGENPNEITSELDYKVNEKKSKSTKKPIFLESSKINVYSDNSPDDFFTEKSLDGYSSSDSKSNSASSKARRNRPFQENTFSGSETGSAGTSRARKDSWEFRNVDDNLHKGLPAYTDNSSNKLLPKRISDLSSDSMNTSNEYTPGSKASRTNGIDYSPTVLNTDIGPNKKTPKKNGFNHFNQFDDPFKSNSKKEDISPRNSKNSSFIESSKKNGSFGYGRKSLNSPGVVDDMEEMFIL